MLLMVGLEADDMRQGNGLRGRHFGRRDIKFITICIVKSNERS